jgi:hypothetical protein
MHPDIDIRIAPAGDPAVTHLALLDSAEPITGPALVGSVDGRAIAAIAYDGGATVADPFIPTADVVELLAERGAQLRGERVAGRLRSWRRGERTARRRPSRRSPLLRPRVPLEAGR